MRPHEAFAFHEIAVALRESGERYCMLHGWRNLGQRETTDIDIAASPGALRVIETALWSNGWQPLQILPYEIGAWFFVASRRSAIGRDFLCLDAIIDFRHNGRIYLGESELLSGARREDGLTVAGPETEFAYLFIKKILKGAFPPRQRVLLKRLASELGPRSLDITLRLLGPRWGGLAHEWIGGERWDALESNSRSLRAELRRSAARRYPRNRIAYWPSELKRIVGRLFRHTGLMVALLGPDGTGKTTLIERLRANLAPAFNDSVVFRMRPDIFKRNLTGVNPAPHAGPVRSAWASVAKLILLLIDYIVGYWVVLKPRLARNDLLLFDRYYHDIFADPVRYRFRRPVWLARLVALLTPRADLFFVLDAPEKMILDRKSEVSLTMLERLRKSYQDLASQLPNCFLIDASHESSMVAQSAGQIICDYLSSRYTKRRLWFGHMGITPAGRSHGCIFSPIALTKKRR